MPDGLLPNRNEREEPGRHPDAREDQAPSAKGKLRPGQVDRLWEYRNQVNNEFFGRLNFFLIFESILLAAAVQLLVAPNIPVLAIKGFVVLGLLITGVWTYAQARIKFILDWLAKLCRQNMPESNLFWAFGNWPVSSMTLLTYIIPLLVALIWIVLFFV